MQDWSYTKSNPKDIQKYLSLYTTTIDEDEKFVLMEFIIQATEDQITEKLFLYFSEKLRNILEVEFKLHQYTIHYWSCFYNENVTECWRITSLMRQIWHENMAAW
jgi:hypothetical protein